MSRQTLTLALVTTLLLMVVTIALISCYPNPQPPGLTPISSLLPPGTLTPIAALPVTAGTTGGTQVLPPGGQANAAVGAPIFLQHCTTCHGVQGEGVDGPPLRNSQFVQSTGDSGVFQVIANGRPGTKMPAWLQPNGGPLTETDIADIIAYLHTLQSVAQVPPATPMPTEAPTATLAPNAPTPEPARPSVEGGPGPALSLTGNADQGRSVFGLTCALCHGPQGVQGFPNPGSNDGSVPVLNPIDPTIANPDPKVFATNVDLYMEHGSVPEGPAPRLMMPAFGDTKMLTDQQIADVVAYVIFLNQSQ